MEVAALHSDHYTGFTLISALIPGILVGNVLGHPLIYYEEIQANYMRKETYVIYHQEHQLWKHCYYSTMQVLIGVERFVNKLYGNATTV